MAAATARSKAVTPSGVHRPADVVGPRRLELRDGSRHVVHGDLRVTVDPHDDVARGGRDRGVETVGGAAGRVADDRHPAVRRCQLGRHRVSAVTGRPEREHDVQGTGPVLVEHLANRCGQVPLLVEDRHDDGDRRPARRRGLLVAHVGHGDSSSTSQMEWRAGPGLRPVHRIRSTGGADLREVTRVRVGVASRALHHRRGARRRCGPRDGRRRRGRGCRRGGRRGAVRLVRAVLGCRDGACHGGPDLLGS